MRCALLATLAGVVALITTAPLSAQGTDKKPPPIAPNATLGGKTITEWIAEISSPDKSRAENAIRTVQMFPPELSYKAVPSLLRELKSHAPDFPLDTSIRVNLVIALGNILGAIEKPDAKQVDESVKLISRFLTGPDQQAIVRYRACQALGRLGPHLTAQNKPTAVAALLKGVNDRATWEIRQAAAIALATVAQDKEKGPTVQVVDQLDLALQKDSASEVRIAALQALTTLGGPAGKVLRQQLEAILARATNKDPEAKVRIWAHMALMSVQGKVEQTHVQAIGSMLDNRELGVRLQALQALMTIGADSKTQLKRIMAALDDSEKVVEGNAIMVLARLGKDAKDALPALTKIRENQMEPDVMRAMADYAIQVIEGLPKVIDNKGKDKGKDNPNPK